MLRIITILAFNYKARLSTGRQGSQPATKNSKTREKNKFFGLLGLQSYTRDTLGVIRAPESLLVVGGLMEFHCFPWLPLVFFGFLILVCVMAI